MTRSDRSGLSVDGETSKRMGRIRQHGTAPELVVRSLLTGMGVRFRTQNRDLPGSPDLANRSRRWAIFVHGCFWHAHAGCPKATIPKRNRAFWTRKFAANVARDERAIEALRGRGFAAIVVWQCQLDSGKLERRFSKLLSRGNRS